MWLSNISIQRPVLAIVMSTLLVLFGLVSLDNLSVREYPDIDPPVISVSTIYPGANAEIIETTVTESLEDELIGIEGIRSMTSSSREGVSNVIIEFELSRNVDVAAQDVRDRVSRARGRLPSDIEEPIIAKQDTDANAIMWLSLHGDNFTQLQVTDYADRYIIDRLQTVDGVGRVMLGGSREYAIRIWLDPSRMAARQVTVLDVESALRTENVEIPSGRIESTLREFTVRTRGELNQPEQFERLIIKRVNGRPVYLSDIGHAEIGARDERSLVRFNGSPAVGLGIVKQSKANTLDVAREVKKILPEIRESLPPGLALSTAYDSSVFIERSIEEVVESLIIAFALVVLVIFLFLRNFRATFIPAVAIPISLISTFIMMNFLGYTLNTITLLGLTLAIGLVVDDNIVVLENVYRRMELGESPMEAAFKGVREVAFAVIATTFVLVAVFLPILFMGGMLGRLLSEFAVVVAGSVLISGFVSLTLAPMLCSRMLNTPAQEARQQQKQRGNLLARVLSGFHQWLEHEADLLQQRLERLMKRKGLIFTSLGVVTLLCLGMYVYLPSEFLPTEDRGTIITIISAPEGATLAYTDKAVRQAEAVYQNIPEVERTFAAIALSADGAGAVNSGMMFTGLKPQHDRHRKQQEIVQEIMPQMMAIPEAFAFPISPPSSPVQGFGKPIELAIQTPGDMRQLADVMARIQGRASTEVFGLMNIDTDLKLDKPELDVEINREKASLVNVSVRDIARTMQILLGGLDLSTFQYGGKQYDVMVQALPETRMTPDQLSNIYVEGKENVMVPLSSLIEAREAVTPKELNHYNRMRAATISAAMMPIPGLSLGSILDQLHTIAQEEIEPGMRLAWKGEAKEFYDANQATVFAFLLALMIVFLVLAAQFESFSDPLIVMLTVPLALIGAILTLFVLSYGPMLIKLIPLFAQWMPVNYGLNVYSQIGMVLLIGLVTKNGILIVEFANQIMEQNPSKSAREAVIEATRIRFRPILMTSIATIVGALPIAVGLGAGIDGRKPMGAVIMGGMFLATFLSLYVVPLMYEWVKTRFRSKTAEHSKAWVE